MSLCALWYSIPQSYLVLRTFISQRTASGECLKSFSGNPKEEKFVRTPLVCCIVLYNISLFQVTTVIFTKNKTFPHKTIYQRAEKISEVV